MLIVDGDSGDAGTLDRAWDLSGATMPNDGFFVLGDSAVAHKDYDLGLANNIENGTMTVYVVSTDDPGALIQLLGQDLDPDGDGVTDIPSLAYLLDVVALVDRQFPGADRVFDGAPAIGPAGSSLPPGIYRGQDVPNPWCGGSFLDFNPAANAEQPRTPGASNGACVPLSLAHFGLEHETLGVAGLALLSDGSLRVSNLQASGQNGVSIDPRGAEHHEVSIELPLGDLPQPAEIEVEESWPQGAGGELLQVSVVAVGEPPDWFFTETWTQVPSPPGECCYLIEV